MCSREKEKLKEDIEVSEKVDTLFFNKWATKCRMLSTIKKYKVMHIVKLGFISPYMLGAELLVMRQECL